MPPGIPNNLKPSLTNSLGRNAVQMRKQMENAKALADTITALGSDGLVANGFTSDEAAAMIANVAFMSIPVNVYYGTVQQGGSDGTGATLVNVNEALAPLWAGQ